MNTKKLNTMLTVQLKSYFSVILILLFTSLLSACQLTSADNPEPLEKKTTVINYNQYYLWLKSLTKAEVLSEEAKQKKLMATSTEQKSLSQGKLILIYCLPSTPLHHPYKAKRLLNELLLVSNTMTQDNLAFSMLLRDQLNSQLYLLQKQERLEKELATQNEANNKNIKQLQGQLNHVNQQLMLLKQIDQNINQRG
ncbi:hypothetical protein [Colwellia sp. E2M01]|uniref:hypothetical protein n=1 Tax=Colwellia sp. E2M01 TaxID=2841561 RepID=UPI001C091740|nr:hypothetical protein [Colwellia sp. E2M01]MBU2869773.1 hypothetical protein [Colwellia sp. E2M01]